MISLKTSITAAQRALASVKRQLPFAAALGLTRTAQAVQAHVTRQLEVRVDKPVPYTRKAYRIAIARKTSLVAEVFALPDQAQYLGIIEDGGTTKRGDPGAKALIGPVKAKVNTFGNVPRGAAAKALSRPDTFVGVPRGDRFTQAGVWRRHAPKKKRSGASGKGRIELLLAFVKKRRHEPSLHFAEDAAAEARRIGPDKMAEALTEVLGR